MLQVTEVSQKQCDEKSSDADLFQPTILIVKKSSFLL